MNFLKKLFSGGDSDYKDDGIYIYVQPRACEEVIQVRLDPRNELSAKEGGGYFVRKIARGNHRCFGPVEMVLHFDSNRKLVESEVEGGELVDEAAYKRWQRELEEKKRVMAEQNAAVDAAKDTGDADVPSTVQQQQEEQS